MKPIHSSKYQKILDVIRTQPCVQDHPVVVPCSELDPKTFFYLLGQACFSHNVGLDWIQELCRLAPNVLNKAAPFHIDVLLGSVKDAAAQSFDMWSLHAVRNTAHVIAACITKKPKINWWSDTNLYQVKALCANLVHEKQSTKNAKVIFQSLLSQPSLSDQVKSEAALLAYAFCVRQNDPSLLAPLTRAQDGHKLTTHLLAKPSQTITLSAKTCVTKLPFEINNRDDSVVDKTPPEVVERLFAWSPDLASAFLEEMLKTKSQPREYFYWSAPSPMGEKIEEACYLYASYDTCRDTARFYKASKIPVPTPLQARLTKAVINHHLQNDSDIDQSSVGVAQTKKSRM